MKPPRLNIIFRLFDVFLAPCMWILGCFTFPLQETHAWHMRKWSWKNHKGLKVRGNDKNALFGHDAPFGLYHMPIFGGLTEYVVIESSGFTNSWHIGWANQIHILPIKDNKIKLLIGKGGFVALGLGDNGKILKLKVVGNGVLGDHKHKGIRLF